MFELGHPDSDRAAGPADRRLWWGADAPTPATFDTTIDDLAITDVERSVMSSPIIVRPHSNPPSDTLTGTQFAPGNLASCSPSSGVGTSSPCRQRDR